MKRAHLETMTGGWFVGDFEPSLLRSQACEVALKRYPAHAHEQSHVHRIAHEITLIVSGRARMNELLLGPGELVLIEPGEATDFTALEDTLTVVVKLPSVPHDKHFSG